MHKLNRVDQVSYNTIQEKEIQLAFAFLLKRSQLLEELEVESYIPSGIELFPLVTEPDSTCIKPYTCSIECSKKRLKRVHRPI